MRQYDDRSPNPLEGNPNFSEGNPSPAGRKSKENRKEIQAFVFHESSLFKDLRRFPQRFFFLKPIAAFWRRARAGAACSPRVVGRSFLSSFPVPPASLSE
jgi:hypothetical protein